MASAEIPKQFKRREIPGRVAFQEGNGELPKLEVHSEHATAEIYLHGAQVTDFKLKGGPPILFTSKFSRYEANQPIRGGIPIIFPWFGAREGEPMHGFARLADWELTETMALPEGGVSLRFSLPETAESAIWPSFNAHYVVTLTQVLQLEFLVTNTSPGTPLIFENCLHTYLAVDQVRPVQIRGLQGLTYLDKVRQFKSAQDQDPALRIESEVDRIYLDATGPVEVIDPGFGRVIRIEKSGSHSTVVWNPWIQKSQQMPDFGTDEYLNMICVESGNVADHKISLPAGRTASLRVTVSSHPLNETH